MDEGLWIIIVKFILRKVFAMKQIFRTLIRIKVYFTGIMHELRQESVFF